MSELFPAFLRLDGRRVLVVGGGPMATQKAMSLLEAGARVTVVAPRVEASLADHGATLVHRAFRPDDLDGVWYVVAAAPPEVNQAVARAAEERRVFVNAVDDPDSCTALAGGVLRRDGVTVAISTSGTAPALARLLREALEELLPEDLGGWVDEAAAARRRWRSRRVPYAERTPLLLDALIRRYGRKSA